jgi:hypothetical protein
MYCARRSTSKRCLSCTGIVPMNSSCISPILGLAVEHTRANSAQANA